MEGFPGLTSVEEALRKLRANINFNPLFEDIELDSALGRMAAKDIDATFDVPAVDRSAVEGYAIVAADSPSTSPINPVELGIIGTSEADSEPDKLPTVEQGNALEIFTGGSMPKGANSVVMVEYCRKQASKVLIFRPVAPGNNVSRRGEDFAKGDVIVRGGTVLKPWHIGALASVNIIKLTVKKRLKIAVMSTGSELREPGEELRPGQIVNSNRPMFKALIAENGCEAVDLGAVPDDMESIQQGLQQGLARADMVMTTGGSSLGERDFMPEAINQLGKPGLVVHGVSMRPAKPTGFGFVDGKPIFMLSGYPVASLVGFEVFVIPAIRWMLNTFKDNEPIVRARLTRKVTTPVGVRSFMRVRIFGDETSLKVEPLRLTGSGILSSMTRANGMLIIPEDVEGYDEGEEVDIRLIQPRESVP